MIAICKRPLLVLPLALALIATGCSKSGDDAGKGKGPTQVGFVVVQPTSVPLKTTLGGRTVAFEILRSPPAGQRRSSARAFHRGRLRPRRAAALPDRSQPLPRRRQPGAGQCRQRARHGRSGPGQGQPLSSRSPTWKRSRKQDYTDAAGAGAAGPRAASRKTAAALDTARINLRYTTVPAPISGRIGRSLFTVGALVSANQTDPLAVIQRLDPIYVDIQQSAADLTALRRSLAARRRRAPAARTVRLKLEDGSDYGYTGTVQFSEISVDESTGTVTLRARFPNPQGLLLPGHVRAGGVRPGGADRTRFLVPQQAVQRDFDGAAFVFVVGPGNKADAPQGRRRPHLRHELGRHRGPQAGRQGHHPGPRQPEAGREVQAGAGRARRRRSSRGQAQGQARGRAAGLARPMSRIFIDRPIFAWVLAIVIMLAGHRRADPRCRSSNIPTSRRRQVNIRASYPGASAETIENSVTQIIEQQLTGHRRAALLQLARRARAGQVEHHRDLRKGHRPRHRPGAGPEPGAAGDLAAAAEGAAAGRAGHQVEPRLPADRRGLRRDRHAHEPWTSRTIWRPTSRTRCRASTGVGDVNVFGSPHAMRIWLNPQRLAAFQLMPSDVIAAIQSAEHRGRGGRGRRPAGAARARCSTRRSRRSRKLQTPEQFAQHHPQDPARRRRRVRLGDVARVELGAENYNIDHCASTATRARASRSRSRPAPTRCKTAELVKAEVARAGRGISPTASTMPTPIDTTDFIKLSVDEVVKTLIEAIVLVVIVMFVFLQNWRATLVPAIAVPVVLLGTFAVFYVARLHDQHADAVRPGAGDRPAGRRRDRRGRERRAPDARKPGHERRAKRPSTRWARSRSR